MISMMYFSVTTTTSAQNTTDSTPYTFAGVSASAVLAGERRAQHVQRTRADVPVDDADRPDDQGGRAVGVGGSGGSRHGEVLRARRALVRYADSSVRREKRMLSCFSLR